MAHGNLFAHAAPPAEGERLDALLEHRGLVIERIVSSSRMASTRYVQEQDEWVVLLQGDAVLDVDGERIVLASGDYVFLPARMPHTVLSVSDGALWLAVHLHGATSAGNVPHAQGDDPFCHPEQREGSVGEDAARPDPSPGSSPGSG